MNARNCDGCDVPRAATPQRLQNRQELSAIAYRVGTFSSFRQAMLQRIAAFPELRQLSTRLSDDPAITLLELWAAVADVLTFYQERVANESFLGTATRRDSVLRLARLLGYALKPGVAATTFLSFQTQPGSQVRIPVGLRVQSVPGQDEKPQKFETLEAGTAHGWLNRLPIFPAPVGTNPLAKGRRSAWLEPGPAALRIGQAVAGENLLLFNVDGSQTPEELTVEEVQVESEQVKLCWNKPIESNAWNLTTRAYRRGRTFRIFGYNAPAQYAKPVVPDDGDSADDNFSVIQWNLEPVLFKLESSYQLPLDSLHTDLQVGSRLLLVKADTPPIVVTIEAVEQAQEQLGPVTDTVTRLTLSHDVATDDRRNVMIIELLGPPLDFWGYTYPDQVTQPTVYLPGGPRDDRAIELLREIQADGYQRGETVELSQIEEDRQVLLTGETVAPVSATVKTGRVVELPVAFTPTPDDPVGVVNLRLDQESVERVVGIVSAVLDPVPELSSTPRRMQLTMGGIGPRLLDLSASGSSSEESSLGDWSNLLEAAIQAADTHPLYTRVRVLSLEGRLVVLPGQRCDTMEFAQVDDDETTVVELGLDGNQVRPVTGLCSGTLDTLPTGSASMRVTIGPVGPVDLPLAPIPTNLDSLGTALQARLQAADPAPCFRYARVIALDDHLLILPGLLGRRQQSYLELQLRRDDPFEIPRESAALLGNVLRASHGETIDGEIVGNGDPTVAFQKFKLRRHPVTRVPAASEKGVENTLRLLVDGHRWQEVDTLYGRGPRDTVYTTSSDDDGTVQICFGDGLAGARPPAGRGNILARYRQGLGVSGQLPAVSLSILLDKPQGLKSVMNPLGTSGGADPETLDEARTNAPGTVKTFDRAVSLRDFEDLVRETGEVAKAKATWVWNGARRAVHLTIAGQNGLSFPDQALARIHASLTARRDPNRVLLLDNLARIAIELQLVITVDADQVARRVAGEARQALLDALSFNSLPFGMPVHLSDIHAILHRVAGVVAVDLDRLMFKQPAGTTPAEFDEFLRLRGISRGADGAITPVQGHLRIETARPNPRLRSPTEIPPGADVLPVLPAEQAWIESPTQDLAILTSGGLPN